MANAIKYTTGSETVALKKGNFYIGTGDVGKGPTNSTGYYNGVDVPLSGYTIYVNNGSLPGGLSYFSAANDTQIISYTNNLANTSYTSATECLTYYSTQTDKIIFNRNYEPISTSGMVFCLDAGFTPSYPTSGTTWYDVQGTNNGTLTNSPGYDNEFGGEILFDGVDDFVSGTEIAELGYTNNYTVIIWLNNNNGGYVMSNKSNVGERFGININSAGTVSGFFYNGSVYTTVGRVTRFGAWEQVVVVNQSQQLTMYVSMNKSTTGGSAVDPGNNGLRIGRRNRTSELYFNGRISQVQVYNRAMTESEILYNYQSMLPRFIGENIVTNGLVFYVDAGYYTSYPQTGTTWYDVSGYNNNGTLSNGPTYSSANGGSILYDGTDDYVSAPNTSSLQITEQITLGSWFKLSSSATGQPTIILKEIYNSATNNSGYLLRNSRSNNSIYIALFNDSINTAGTSDNSINLDTWYYACGTYDGSQIKMYLNGVLKGTTNYSGGIKSNTSTLYIGQSSTGYRMNGNVAVTQIYNRALTAAEVIQNYNTQKGRFGL